MTNKPEAGQMTLLDMPQEFIRRMDMLRVPFSENMISKLPKPTLPSDKMRDLPKGKCDVCGGYHATRNIIHLDYVGHAALTDRLNAVDPCWTWEPLAYDEHGLPRYDHVGGMWGRLTILGVTRLGYGHAGDKKGGDAIKEIIGDFLRNAAMRFGCALDLWHKGDWWVDDDGVAGQKPKDQPKGKTPEPPPDDKPGYDWSQEERDTCKTMLYGLCDTLASMGMDDSYIRKATDNLNNQIGDPDLMPDKWMDRFKNGADTIAKAAEKHADTTVKEATSRRLAAISNSGADKPEEFTKAVRNDLAGKVDKKLGDCAKRMKLVELIDGYIKTLQQGA